MRWNNPTDYGVGLICLLCMWTTLSWAEPPTLPPAPSIQPEIVVTVTIDKAKTSYGRTWDLNPFGPAPDVYGKILIGNYAPTNVKLRMDSYYMRLRFKNYILNVGENIYIALYDRDRARPDNLIAKGKITYDGEPEIEVRLQHAVVKLEFKGVQLAGWYQ